MSDDQNNTTPDPNTPPATDPNTETVEYWKAQAEEWKGYSRKHEDGKKAALTELDKIKASQMTDSEKAIAEAKASARSEALSEVRGQLGESALKTAAATSGVQIPEALGALVDASKFVNDDGTPNVELINSVVSSFAPNTPPPPAFSQAVGVGPQSSVVQPGQVTREQLAQMTPAEIVKAKNDGLLNHLMVGG